MQNLLIDCYPPTCPASRVLMMVHFSEMSEIMQKAVITVNLNLK